MLRTTYLKAVVSVFSILLISEVLSELELSVNGTLLPCTKKDENDLKPPYHIIENCNRKIRLLINILNSGKTPEGFQYIYVKEISDVNGVKMNLLHPIVLQLRQDQVVLAYPFKYLSAVNGKVSELVINNENKKNYSGCDDTSSINPTCGIKFEKGVAVPYSEGFCCFCPEKPVKQKQIRGGQDCSLPIDSEDFEKHKYKASAHCLHFSDIWFSVSALGDPVIIHNLFLQVFNQRHLTNGSSLWFSLTHGEEFELSPKSPSKYDDNKTIVATFMTASPKNGTIVISAENNRLLIPQPMPGIGVDKLPPVLKNGASDYILLSKSIIEPEGDECDKAGISFEGFVKQQNRCKVTKNTCLKNQPLDFWEGDEQKRKGNKKGNYLLYNYGQPYKDPILIDQETKEHWLALEYHDKQLTLLTVEFNADDIIALTVGKDAHITTVITASYEKTIVFSVTITNTGLVEAAFSVRAIECEYEVSNSDSLTHVVLPQLTEEFVLTSFPGKIVLDEKFSCTIAVSSKMYGVVAKRKVTIKPLHRCICNWHCRCVCLGESIVCIPLSEEEFHVAGFKGSLPVLTAKPPHIPWIIKHPFLALFSLLLLLFIIGGIKAIFGVLGYDKIGHYGLESRIYRPGPIKQYVEPDLRLMDVMYDKDGFPVHPDLKFRTKAIPTEIICSLNVIFCFVWPLILLYDYCKNKLKSKEINENSEKVNSSYSNDEISSSSLRNVYKHNHKTSFDKKEPFSETTSTNSDLSLDQTHNAHYNSEADKKKPITTSTSSDLSSDKSRKAHYNPEADKKNPFTTTTNSDLSLDQTHKVHYNPEADKKKLVTLSKIPSVEIKKKSSSIKKASSAEYYSRNKKAVTKKISKDFKPSLDTELNRITTSATEQRVAGSLENLVSRKAVKYSLSDSYLSTPADESSNPPSAGQRLWKKGAFKAAVLTTK